MEIYQEGHPTITAVALTSRGALEEESRLTEDAAGHYTEQCQLGSSRMFSLRQQDQHIATTELLRSADHWIHWQTADAAGATPTAGIAQAALVLARAYRTAAEVPPSHVQLNPLLPDPDGYEYADERIKKAATLGQQAGITEYDPANPLTRAVIWAECLEQARIGAQQPNEMANLHEVAFAHQLAVNAAIMCQRYDDAAEMLPHALAAGKNVQQITKAATT